MKELITTCVLYGLLGGLLGMAGVSIVNTPVLYFSIVATVVLIDLSSRIFAKQE